jgi:hypothetical protein
MLTSLCVDLFQMQIKFTLDWNFTWVWGGGCLADVKLFHYKDESYMLSTLCVDLFRMQIKFTLDWNFTGWGGGCMAGVRLHKNTMIIVHIQ